MVTTGFSGSLFIVAAPSGAGKSTLVNALLAQEPGIQLSISTTTRQHCPGFLVDLGDHEGSGAAPRYAEYPLDIRGYRKASGST